MDARTLALPITKVTVLEDRALVERRGEVTLGPGTHRLRVEGVTPLVVDRSLRGESATAKLVDVRVARAWKERPAGGLAADASALKRRVHELEKAIADADADAARRDARVRLVEQALELGLRRICEEAGAGIAELDRWKADVARLRNEAAAAHEAHRTARRQAARLRLDHEAARVALQRAEMPEAELTAALELVVEATANGPAQLSVSYLVPNALWRPAYRATLRRAQGGNGDPAATPGGERVLLEADAVIWQRTGEAWNDVQLVVSTARPTLGTKPPVLLEDRLRLREKSEIEKRVVHVDVREEEIQTLGEGGAIRAAEMPGLDDGGETRVIPVEGAHRLPSDGAPHRLRLFHFEAPARSELLCVPELSPLIARVASFENAGPQVLLAGPVDLVRESGYVGRTQLRFAAQRERIRLGFGTEDALRVTRTHEEKRDEAMLTGRRKTTTAVKLFLSNAGGEGVRMAVEERIPKSEIAEVEVKLDAKGAQPPPSSVSEEGIVRFELDLGPRQQRTIEYKWELSAAAKVAGL